MTFSVCSCSTSTVFLASVMAAAIRWSRLIAPARIRTASGARTEASSKYPNGRPIGHPSTPAIDLNVISGSFANFVDARLCFGPAPPRSSGEQLVGRSEELVVDAAQRNARPGEPADHGAQERPRA